MFVVQQKRKKKETEGLTQLACCLALLGSTVILGAFKFAARQHAFSNPQNNIHKRDVVDDSLLSIDPNQTHCKSPTIHEFPRDFIPFDEFKYSSLS
jgi:hypothetical protein